MIVDIYVSGDGGDWSLAPSKLFQIPSDLFDKAMAVYSLNSQQDLHELAQKARREVEEGKRKSYTESSNEGACSWTTVYAAHDGSWAGLPPVHFQIPADVFEYILADTTGKRSKALGWLESEASLSKLVETSREEMAEDELGDPALKAPCANCSRLRMLGSLESEAGTDGKPDLEEIRNICRLCADVLRYARHATIKRTEVKACGHTCTISSVKDSCCKCADLRPELEGNCYPCYTDGEGWADKASRGAGYCPVCHY